MLKLFSNTDFKYRKQIWEVENAGVEIHVLGKSVVKEAEEFETSNTSLQRDYNDGGVIEIGTATKIDILDK